MDGGGGQKYGLLNRGSAILKRITFIVVAFKSQVIPNKLSSYYRLLIVGQGQRGGYDWKHCFSNLNQSLLTKIMRLRPEATQVSCLEEMLSTSFDLNFTFNISLVSFSSSFTCPLMPNRMIFFIFFLPPMNKHFIRPLLDKDIKIHPSQILGHLMQASFFTHYTIGAL